MQYTDPAESQRNTQSTTHAPFEGTLPPFQTAYGPASSPQGVLYDDNFIEALSQRLALRMTDELLKKANLKNAPSSAQRLALAIVSLITLFVLMIVIFAISINVHQIWGAIIAAVILSMAICIVNIVFNIGHR